MNESKCDHVVDDVNRFLKTSWESLSTILDRIGWTAEHVVKTEMKNHFVTCPLDPAHRMPAEKLGDHMLKCSFVKAGYSKEEFDTLPPSSSFFYENCAGITPVRMNQSLQTSILQNASAYGDIPSFSQSGVVNPLALTPDRETVYLTPSQRLAVYQHVVEEARNRNPQWSAIKPEDLQLDFSDNNKAQNDKKSELEIMKEQRDHKRRRQTYRAKNVHITKKKYTDIVKEVIDGQMSFLRHMQGEDEVNDSENEQTRKAEDDRISLRLSPSSKESESRRHTPSRDAGNRHHKSHFRDHSRRRSRSRSKSRVARYSEKSRSRRSSTERWSAGSESTRSHRHKHKRSKRDSS